jgi:hypothetical protein
MKYEYSNRLSIHAKPETVYDTILLQLLPHYSRKKIVQQNDANREVTIRLSKAVVHNYRCDSNSGDGTKLTATAFCDFGNLFNAGVLLPVFLPLIQYFAKPRIRKAVDQLAEAAKKLSEKA